MRAVLPWSLEFRFRMDQAVRVLVLAARRLSLNHP